MDLLRAFRALPRFDIALAVVLTALSATDSVLSERHWTAPVWVIGIVGGLALAWRRQAPAAILLGTTTADACASVLLSADGPISVVVIVSLFTVASRQGLTARNGVLLTGCTLSEALLASGPVSAGRTTFVVVVMLIVILAGLWIGARRAKIAHLHERVEAAERERGLRAAAAVAEERLRIAREVHDLLAHSLSVIVIQASAGADAFDRRPDRGHQALTAIEGVGRDALRELRSLVGALSEERPSTPACPDVVHASQPVLDMLPTLVERVRSTGLEVHLQMPADLTGIPAAIGLSAYRIIQEALTNTMRHARAQTVTVALTRTGEALGIEVVDDGKAVAARASVSNGDGHPPDPWLALGAGRGLVGMRERAAAFGGTITAQPRPDGGFTVRARLPLTRESS